MSPRNTITTLRIATLVVLCIFLRGYSEQPAYTSGPQRSPQSRAMRLAADVWAANALAHRQSASDYHHHAVAAPASRNDLLPPPSVDGRLTGGSRQARPAGAFASVWHNRAPPSTPTPQQPFLL